MELVWGDWVTTQKFSFRQVGRTYRGECSSRELEIHEAYIARRNLVWQQKLLLCLHRAVLLSSKGLHVLQTGHRISPAVFRAGLGAMEAAHSMCWLP